MSMDTACAVGLIVTYLFTLGIAALILSRRKETNDRPTGPVDTAAEDALRIHSD